MPFSDKFPVGLNFQDNNDKIQLANPVSLGESWTVETWLSLSSLAKQNLEQNLEKYTEEKLQASEPQQDACFGNSVAICGNTALVGAYQEDSKAGVAYIFEFDSNGTWLEKQKLTASDSSTGDLFGRSVAISGNVAIVGADDEDTGGKSAGAAYIFERNNSGTWTEKAKIQASDKQASDNFGYSVSISDNFALVGAYGEDTGGSSAGAAYIFERDSNGNWSEKAKIQASDKQASDCFGNAVAISSNIAIVGAWKEDTGGSNAGAAYIFERDSSGNWSETKQLFASNAEADDRFGRSVAISGNIAIVGADNEGTGGKSTGAAYIFERNNSGTWTEKIKLQANDKQQWDNFGYSVSISGNIALVGAYGQDTEGSNAGAAYIFERDNSGTWSDRKKLFASDAEADDNFGNAVAIGDNFAVVGSPKKDTGGSNAGSAYIFTVADVPVPEQANRIFEQKQKLLASDAGANDHFGTSVAISGNIAIVGATSPPRMYHPVPGTAYIFELNSSETGTEIQKLQASDAKILDNFGTSVDISGNIAIVGAIGVSTAYIFERDSNGTWSEKAKLQASDAEAGDNFGYSVSISGNIAIVGAYREDTGGGDAGSAYVFERDNNGTWNEKAKLQASDAESRDNFGYSVSISGNIAIVGALSEDTGGSNAGAAYIFERGDNGTWTETQKVQASDPEANDFFGVSVAINNNFAIVGAPREDMGGSNAGAAYIFERGDNGTWREGKKILASDPVAGDLFGHSIAINNNFVIVGARKKDTGGSDAGAAYIFERDSNGTWSEGKKILASDPKAGDEFGHSVAISNNFAIVGSPKEDTGGSSAGAAYIFAGTDVPVPESTNRSLERES
ncbi:MAG: FG-GAP repeat protein, partial [Waterburya sp.]